MKEEKDYLRDIAEIRSLMERSSKFLSLSGWAGIMAGVYALAGAFIAWKINPHNFIYNKPYSGNELFELGIVFLIVLLLAVSTAIFDAYKKAQRKSEKAWNAISKRLLINMAVPLVAGGLLVIILIHSSLIVFAAPLTLLFYGIALFNAGNFTFKAVKILGIIQMCFGLLSFYFIDYAWLFWIIGFGIMHILYGVYMFRYTK